MLIFSIWPMSRAPGELQAIATLLAWCEDAHSCFTAPTGTCIASHVDTARELAHFASLGQRGRPQHLQRSRSQPSPAAHTPAALSPQQQAPSGWKSPRPGATLGALCCPACSCHHLGRAVSLALTLR
jgi:hypothetical protein